MSSVFTQAHFQCEVNTCGNPDFGQPRNWHQRCELFTSNSIEGLRQQIQAFIKTEDLGAGNIQPMSVYFYPAGRDVVEDWIGELAYNGRFIMRQDRVKEAELLLQELEAEMLGINDANNPHASASHRTRLLFTIANALTERNILRGTIVLRKNDGDTFRSPI